MTQSFSFFSLGKVSFGKKTPLLDVKCSYVTSEVAHRKGVCCYVTSYNHLTNWLS